MNILMAFLEFTTMFMLFLWVITVQLKAQKQAFVRNILMSSAVFPFETEQERKRPAIVRFCSSILREQMVTLLWKALVEYKLTSLFPCSKHSLTAWLNGPGSCC